MSYNCRVYDYPQGQHVTLYKRPIIEERQMSENFKKSYSKKEGRTEKEIEHCASVSLNRTKNEIYNLARSNNWELFITLTFNRAIIDSSDYDEVTKRLQKFLQNLKMRYCKNLIYLIVPELHADGEHYHFHGILSNIDGLKLLESGHVTENNEIIYNLPQWTFGFTTATFVKDTQRVSAYITKYITKEITIQLKNKKRYYASRNIKRTEAEYHNIDVDEFYQTYAESITYVKSVNIPEAYQHVTFIEVDA